MGHALPRQTRTDANRATTQPTVPTRASGRTADQAAGRTTKAQRTQHRQLTPVETIAGVDRLTGNTPNADIERLLMSIDRHRRERTPVPKNAGYRGNWEWVQFEITRRLKRAIKERDEVIARIGRQIVEDIKQLARPHVIPARKPTQAQSQAGQPGKKRVQQLRAA